MPHFLFDVLLPEKWPSVISATASLLSIVFASIKLFFSLRLEPFSDFDPSLRLIFFTFPFILGLISAPLVSVMAIVSRFDADSPFSVFLLFVLLLFPIFSTALAFFRATLNKNLNNKDPLEMSDSLRIFYTAVFSSWISPCCVYFNYFAHKSFFLITSSLMSNLIYAAITTSFFLEYKYFNEYLPEFFYFKSYYALLIIFFLSICSSLCLQHLGSYYNMYRWTKRLKCCSPIIHSSLLHDFIINKSKLPLEIENDMSQVVNELIKSNPSIANSKESFHGNTLMHAALNVVNLELLEQFIQAGGNFLLRNNSGISVEQQIREIFKNEETNQKLNDIIELLDAKKETLESTVPNKVWSEQPMFRALNQDNFFRLCIFLLLGGNINIRPLSQDYPVPLFKSLLQKILKKPQVFSSQTNWIQRFLTRVRNEHGNTLLLEAIQEGSCPEVLLSYNIKMRNSKDGRTALHGLVLASCKPDAGHVEIAKKLIEKGLDINATDFQKRTPLHLAAESNNQEMAEYLLVDCGANVDAKDFNGKTALDYAEQKLHSDMADLLKKHNNPTTTCFIF